VVGFIEVEVRLRVWIWCHDYGHEQIFVSN